MEVLTTHLEKQTSGINTLENRIRKLGFIYF